MSTYSLQYIRSIRRKIAFYRRLLKKIKKVYLVGIGGVGMSGLAYLLKEKGYIVSGSDIAFSQTVARLNKKGICIYIGHKPEQIKDADLVCFSSAISPDNPELVFAKRLGIPLISRGLLLACLAQEEKVLAVAGSHGKTTTTALIGFLLKKIGIRCSTFLGGSLKRKGTSTVWGREIFVIETDESDGSFNFIQPYYSLITNIDKEHLNFYHDSWDELQGAFGEFVAQTKKIVIGCAEDRGVAEILAQSSCRNITYGIRRGNFRAHNLKLFPLYSHFDLYFRDHKLLHMQIPLGGKHNILNFLGATAAVVNVLLEKQGKQGKKDVKEICLRLQKYIKHFPGVKRRLEILGKKGGIIFISDYAHHPSEIKAAIKAAHYLKPSRLVVVFQPHRPSRLKSLISDFATAFYGSDFLIVTDIYLASERPQRDVDVNLLISKLRYPCRKNIVYLQETELKRYIPSLVERGDVLLALGAGSIDSIMRGIYKHF